MKFNKKTIVLIFFATIQIILLNSCKNKTTDNSIIEHFDVKNSESNASIDYYKSNEKLLPYQDSINTNILKFGVNIEKNTSAINELIQKKINLNNGGSCVKIFSIDNTIPNYTQIINYELNNQEQPDFESKIIRNEDAHFMKIDELFSDINEVKKIAIKYFISQRLNLVNSNLKAYDNTLQIDINSFYIPENYFFKNNNIIFTYPSKDDFIMLKGLCNFSVPINELQKYFKIPLPHSVDYPFKQPVN